MLLSQALDAVHKFTPHKFSALADLLSRELIDKYLTDTGDVTLRKRRLSMEMMIPESRYRVLRFMMGQMAYSLKGVEPYQMGFKQSALYLRSHLHLLGSDTG